MIRAFKRLLRFLLKKVCRMIPGLCPPPNHGLDKGSSMRETINALGLTSNLKLLLDAGDLASVSNASQTKWLDISGNGYDFYRGSGSGSDSADPSFSGTVGAQSANEYWSFGGGDYFTYDTSNETWMNALHKDSAAFTIMGWARLTSSDFSLLGTGTPGVRIAFSNGSGIVTFNVGNSTGPLFKAFTGLMSVTVPTGDTFFAIRVDEASNTWSVVFNSTATTDTCTYVSPSSSSAAATMLIAATDVDSTAPSGSRLYSIVIHQGVALTTAQIASVYNATKGKFGL